MKFLLFMFGVCAAMIVLTLTIKVMLIPLQVETKPSTEQLNQACVMGYVGKLKPVTTDLVVDAYVFCQEKYP